MGSDSPQASRTPLVPALWNSGVTFAVFATLALLILILHGLDPCGAWIGDGAYNVVTLSVLTIVCVYFTVWVVAAWKHALLPSPGRERHAQMLQFLAATALSLASLYTSKAIFADDSGCAPSVRIASVNGSPVKSEMHVACPVEVSGVMGSGNDACTIWLLYRAFGDADKEEWASVRGGVGGEIVRNIVANDWAARIDCARLSEQDYEIRAVVTADHHPPRSPDRFFPQSQSIRLRVSSSRATTQGPAAADDVQSSIVGLAFYLGSDRDENLRSTSSHVVTATVVATTGAWPGSVQLQWEPDGGWDELSPLNPVAYRTHVFTTAGTKRVTLRAGKQVSAVRTIEIIDRNP